MMNNKPTGYSVRLEIVAAKLAVSADNVTVCVQVGREYKWSPAIKSNESVVKSGKDHKWKDQKFMVTIDDPLQDRIKIQCWSSPWFRSDNVGEGSLSCTELPNYSAPIAVKVTLLFRAQYAGEVEVIITPATVLGAPVGSFTPNPNPYTTGMLAYSSPPPAYVPGGYNYTHAPPPYTGASYPANSSEQPKSSSPPSAPGDVGSVIPPGMFPPSPYAPSYGTATAYSTEPQYPGAIPVILPPGMSPYSIPGTMPAPNPYAVPQPYPQPMYNSQQSSTTVTAMSFYPEEK